MRLTPKANAARVDGIAKLSDGRSVLAVRVSAPPENGKANAALLKLLAEQFGWPQSDISVASGTRSRVKRIVVAGDPLVLAQRLENWFKSAD